MILSNKIAWEVMPHVLHLPRQMSYSSVENTDTKQEESRRWSNYQRLGVQPNTIIFTNISYHLSSPDEPLKTEPGVSELAF